jgi:putative ABC transport system substrate-binding protein
MNRRQAVLAMLALGATPLGAFAQQAGKVWRIGFLYLSTQTVTALRLDAFKQAFRDLGYIEGRDYVLELRFADNHGDRLPMLAAELVRSSPDLIMAGPATPTIAMQKATATIPIVMVSVGDPVGSGLVKSLAHPGGNVTGTSNSLTDIAPKHLDLLHEIVPKMSRLAVLMNPNYQSHRDALKILQTLAPRIGVQILPIEAQSAQEIENGFSLMTKQNARAIIVVTDAIYLERRWQIAELAMKNRLPCVGYSQEYADAGFLFGYGPNSLEFFRRAAVYVDKILKGAKPADLPVEQPTTFELVINLKTAKALGIKIPQSVQIRADRVIE